MPQLAALLRDLSDPQTDRRVQAALELGNLGPAAAGAAASLAAALADGALRGAAAWALVKIGRAAAPALLEALRHPEAAARLAALGALWKIAPESGSTALEGIAGALRDGEAEVRRYAAFALGEIGRRAAPAVEALAAALADPEPSVREAAAAALGRVGEPSEPAIYGLSGVLQDPAVRAAAARALCALAGTRAPLLQTALPVLDHLARRGERTERALYREAAAAIRAATLQAGRPPRDSLPRPAGPRSEPDAGSLPVPSGLEMPDD